MITISYNRRHYCNKIKSILHFDYPYMNEPNDGLKDDAQFEKWKKVGNVKFVARSTPCDEIGAPKFGYRCAKFNLESYIESTNNNNIWNLNSDKSYEIEFFIKPIPIDLENCYFFNDHTYKFFDSVTTWENAKTLCEENSDGHLAIINNKDTNEFIKSLQPKNSYYWIGGHTTAIDTWQWVDEDIDWYFSDWDNEIKSDSIAALMSYYNTKNRKWIQSNKNNNYGYLCEWDRYISDIKYNSAPIFNIPDNFEISINDNGQIKITSILLNIELLSLNTLSPNIWNHLMVRISNNNLYLFINGSLDSSSIITSGVSFENIEKVELGKFNGYIDEFIFRHTNRKNSEPDKIQVPRKALQTYLTKYRINNFGDGSLDNVIITSDKSKSICINSYGMIKSLNSSRNIILNGRSNSDYDNNKYSFNVGDEVLFYICARKDVDFYSNENSRAQYINFPLKTFNGHTYKLFNTTRYNWDQAKRFCEYVGGHLVVILDQDTKNFIINNIYNYDGSQVFLGGHKINHVDTNPKGTGNDTWYWITEDTEWNEFNTSCINVSQLNTNENALTITINNKWGDANDNSQLRFICEWDFEVNTYEEIIDLINKNDKVGLYAFRNIKKINSELDILIDEEINNEFKLNDDLLKDYYIQIIKVPHFKNLTIDKNITIIPSSFNVAYGGGIVIFKCTENCIVNGKIITHGYGYTRYDFVQMTNSELINRFLISKGGGAFIACGKSFIANTDSRIGALYSGVTSGCGGGSSSPAGRGGPYGIPGGYGFGLEGGYRYSQYYGIGGTGGGQGASGGNHSINGSVGTSGSTNGSGGGGAPGGDGGYGARGGNGGIAGANVLIFCEKTSIKEDSISTGGSLSTEDGSGGGTGFCYIFANKKLGWEKEKDNEQ